MVNNPQEGKRYYKKLTQSTKVLCSFDIILIAPSYDSEAAIKNNTEMCEIENGKTNNVSRGTMIYLGVHEGCGLWDSGSSYVAISEKIAEKLSCNRMMIVGTSEELKEKMKQVDGTELEADSTNLHIVINNKDSEDEPLVFFNVATKIIERKKEDSEVVFIGLSALFEGIFKLSKKEIEFVQH